ncbi:hypothetical protein H2199_003615 [Coniosporium tulheliwenetii]|uniref:Uncharacterized protein n=1 Tax=Coniosporium tulheliwenetii TaxID=3383036 RepID=A0ACC2ZA84_9PEZI|nr:hypothetical protein H2199_003615 [Cladosporium sp. JES 115]
MSATPRRSTRIATSRGTTPVASTYAASNVGTASRRTRRPESGALPALPTTQSSAYGAQGKVTLAKTLQVRGSTTGFLSTFHEERVSVSPEASELGSPPPPSAGTDFLDGGDVTTSQDISKSFGLTHEAGAGVGDRLDSIIHTGRRSAYESHGSSIQHNHLTDPPRRPILRNRPAPTRMPNPWHIARNAFNRRYFPGGQPRWWRRSDPEVLALYALILGFFTLILFLIGYFAGIRLPNAITRDLGTNVKYMGSTVKDNIPNPFNVFTRGAAHTVFDHNTRLPLHTQSIHESVSKHDQAIRWLQSEQRSLKESHERVQKETAWISNRLSYVGRHSEHIIVPTTRVNFFSAALGAVVDPHLTSPTQVKSLSWGQYFWTSLPVVWVPKPRPAIAALEPWSEAGDCWCAARSRKGQAQLAVLIPKPVFPSSVTIEHVPKAGALDITSAPKDFEVWVEGCSSDAPAPGYACIGGGTYSISSLHHVQEFPTIDMEDFGVPIRKAVVRIKSNWGQGWTCIYRVSMHGSAA